MDGQEQTNIESEIDDQKSDNVQINQVVESVETEKSRDAELQEPQSQAIEAKQVDNIAKSEQQQEQLGRGMTKN